MLEEGVIISGGLFSVSESLFCGWIIIMVNPYYCVAIYVLYIHIHTYMIDRLIDRYNRAQSKCTKLWKQSSAIKQLLETFFSRHKNLKWLHYRWYMYEHKVCSVISKPSQNSSRCASSFKYSLVLLNSWEVNFTKVKSLEFLAHCLW